MSPTWPIITPLDTQQTIRQLSSHSNNHTLKEQPVCNTNLSSSAIPGIQNAVHLRTRQQPLQQLPQVRRLYRRRQQDLQLLRQLLPRLNQNYHDSSHEASRIGLGCISGLGWLHSA